MFEYLPSLGTFLATFGAAFVLQLALVGWIWWLGTCSVFEYILFGDGFFKLLGVLLEALIAAAKGD